MLCLEKYIISNSTKAARKMGSFLHCWWGKNCYYLSGKPFIICIQFRAPKTIHTLTPFLENCVKERDSNKDFYMKTLSLGFLVIVK